MSTTKEIAAAIVRFLRDVPRSEVSGDAEGLDVAAACVSTAFGVQEGDVSQAVVLSDTWKQLQGKKDISPESYEEKLSKFVQLCKDKGMFRGLEEGTAAYEERIKAVRMKFEQRHGPAPAAAAAAATSPVDRSVVKDAAAALRLKEEGNQLIRSGKYAEAAAKYTEAIENDSTSPIYFSNRAAAYSHLQKHREAIADAEKAISLDGNFVKAYIRLGFAHFSLGEYESALSRGYEPAQKMDPTNRTVQDYVDLCRKRVEEEKSSAPPTETASGAPAFNFADLMSNPMVQQMASQFASNPAMQQMAMNMMSNMGGGGAGTANASQNDSDSSSMWNTGPTADTGAAAAAPNATLGSAQPSPASGNESSQGPQAAGNPLQEAMERMSQNGGGGLEGLLSNPEIARMAPDIMRMFGGGAGGGANPFGGAGGNA